MSDGHFRKEDATLDGQFSCHVIRHPRRKKRCDRGTASVNLGRVGNAASFPLFLDRATEELRRALPRRARYWGRARKCMNLFMRHCSYNFLLRKRFKLGRLDKVLETPLDRFVVEGLRSDARGETLPKWSAIVHLTAEDNAAFQAIATKIAKRKYGTHRVHLDLWYWRPATKIS
jgi:hypothetical protein